MTAHKESLPAEIVLLGIFTILRIHYARQLAHRPTGRTTKLESVSLVVKIALSAQLPYVIRVPRILTTHSVIFASGTRIPSEASLMASRSLC
jgi:hypothetical protein